MCKVSVREEITIELRKNTTNERSNQAHIILCKCMCMVYHKKMLMALFISYCSCVIASVSYCQNIRFDILYLLHFIFGLEE